MSAKFKFYSVISVKINELFISAEERYFGCYVKIVKVLAIAVEL